MSILRRGIMGAVSRSGMSIAQLVTALNNGETFTDEEVNAICGRRYGALVKIKGSSSMTITFNYGTSTAKYKTVDNTGSSTAQYFWVDSEVKYTTIRGLIEMNNTAAARGNLLELRYLYMPSTVVAIINAFNGATNVTRLNLSNWNNYTFKSLSAFVNATSALSVLDMSTMTIDCTSLNQFLNHCNNLTEVRFGTIDFSNLTSISTNTWTMPFYVTSLTTITGNLSNIGKGFTSNCTFDLSYTNLNHDSAMRIINALVAPTASGVTATLKLKAATYNTLSADEKALITTAGWIDGNAT